MFNQVAVPEEDQVALRLLWRQSPESPIEVYQSKLLIIPNAKKRL